LKHIAEFIQDLGFRAETAPDSCGGRATVGRADLRVLRACQRRTDAEVARYDDSPWAPFVVESCAGAWNMIDIQHLRDRAARCLQLADNLLADAETLKRFGEELGELARALELNRAGAELGNTLPLGFGARTPLSS
jgi:hypothetical protein